MGLYGAAATARTKAQENFQIRTEALAAAIRSMPETNAQHLTSLFVIRATEFEKFLRGGGKSQRKRNTR